MKRRRPAPLHRAACARAPAGTAAGTLGWLALSAATPRGCRRATGAPSPPAPAADDPPALQCAPAACMTEAGNYTVVAMYRVPEGMNLAPGADEHSGGEHKVSRPEAVGYAELRHTFGQQAGRAPQAPCSSHRIGRLSCIRLLVHLLHIAGILYRLLQLLAQPGGVLCPLCLILLAAICRYWHRGAGASRSRTHST